MNVSESEEEVLDWSVGGDGERECVGSKTEGSG